MGVLRGSLRGRATLHPHRPPEEGLCFLLFINFCFGVKSGRSAFLSVGKQDRKPVIGTLKSHLCAGGYRGGHGGATGRRDIVPGVSQTGL